MKMRDRCVSNGSAATQGRGIEASDGHPIRVCLVAPALVVPGGQGAGTTAVRDEMLTIRPDFRSSMCARTARLHTLASADGEHWVAAPIAGRAPRPVRALCLLDRGIGRVLEARVLDARFRSLEPHILGSWGGDFRQRERSRLYADLASSTTLLSLSASLEEPPHALYVG